MNTKLTLEKLKSIIEVKANQDIPYDAEDFCADDYTGGNVDDAWASGMNDGEVLYARELLHIINNN